jgi:AcrR family transcriptional regulator
MRTTVEDVEQQKKRIIAKSIEHFSNRGYKETLLSDISSDLNITNGPLYYHYKNKMGLFCAATVSFLNSHIEEAERIFSSSLSFFEKLEEDLLYFYQKDTVNSGKYFLDIGSVTKKSPYLTQVFSDYVSSLWNIKYKAVKRAIEDGELKSDADPQEFTDIIFIMYEGIIFRHSIQSISAPERTIEQRINSLLEILKFRYAI